MESNAFSISSKIKSVEFFRSLLCWMNCFILTDWWTLSWVSFSKSKLEIRQQIEETPNMTQVSVSYYCWCFVHSKILFPITVYLYAYFNKLAITLSCSNFVMHCCSCSMLSNNKLAHSSNDHKLLFCFVFQLSFEFECVDVVLERVLVCVRAWLWSVIGLNCVCDGDADDVAALMVLAYVGRDVGCENSGAWRVLFVCVRIVCANYDTRNIRQRRHWVGPLRFGLYGNHVTTWWYCIHI